MKKVKKKTKKIKPKLRLKLKIGVEPKDNIVESSNWDNSSKNGYRYTPAFCFTRQNTFIIDLGLNDPLEGTHDLTDQTAIDVSKTFLKFINKHYRMKTVFTKQEGKEIFVTLQKLVVWMAQLS